jgi:hypothetical protein
VREQLGQGLVRREGPQLADEDGGALAHLFSFARSAVQATLSREGRENGKKEVRSKK